MATAFCQACGASLGKNAKFCRACGTPLQVAAAAPPTPPAPDSQDPPPPRTYPPVVMPPPPVPSPQAAAASPAASGAAILAIGGGLGMCLITVYAIIYRPLHFHDPVNYGESLQFGDLFLLIAGLAAIAVGVSMFAGRHGNQSGRAALLALAGIPALVLTVLWSFPVTFHLSVFPEQPFYFGIVFFSEFGNVHVGQDGEVPAPLLLSCLAVVVAALLTLVPSKEAQPPYER